MKKYLVLIRQKDWQPCEFNYYIEVMAETEVWARYKGFDEFMEKVKYQPRLQLQMKILGLDRTTICAPEAIEI